MRVVLQRAIWGPEQKELTSEASDLFLIAGKVNPEDVKALPEPPTQVLTIFVITCETFFERRSSSRWGSPCQPSAGVLSSTGMMQVYVPLPTVTANIL